MKALIKMGKKIFILFFCAPLSIIYVIELQENKSFTKANRAIGELYVAVYEQYYAEKYK